MVKLHGVFLAGPGEPRSSTPEAEENVETGHHIEVG
jgi:hypothetical protein